MRDDPIFTGSDPHTLARSGDPSTSHEAAHAVDSKKWEERVYRAIKASGYRGCTSDDIRNMYADATSSVTARFKPLRDKGLVFNIEDNKETGAKGVKRKGNKGRLMYVHWAVEFRDLVGE